MTVKQEDFPGCCTATILVDFGQSSTSEFGYKHAVEKQKMRKQVIDHIKDAHYQAVVVAITTDEQKIGIEVLTELGFQATPSMHKTQHAERTIQLWHLPVQGWKEPVDPEKFLPKRDAKGRFAPKAANPFVKKEVAIPKGYYLINNIGNGSIVTGLDKNGSITEPVDFFGNVPYVFTYSDEELERLVEERVGAGWCALYKKAI